jgi:chitin disaccharide deacetylase
MVQPSLAERLGYGPEDRLLIVNCDDLGSSHSANVATLRSMVHGVATSATLMVPCPWAREAARMFEGFAVGVHLTLTCEYRGYRWRSLTNGASLHDHENFFPTTTEAALQRVGAADVRAECRAQLETALSWGVDVTHLDAHMNVMQARSDLYEIYLDLAEEFRRPVRVFSREDIEKQGLQPRERAGARGLLFNEQPRLPMAQTHAGRVFRGDPEAAAWRERDLRPPGARRRGTARLRQRQRGHPRA